MSDTSSPFRVRAAKEVTGQDYSWLWKDRLALGEPAIFEGDPGLGKSLVALDLCARLSAGRDMPDGSPGPGQCNSLVLSEEDAAETVRRRLEGLGADMDRVFLLDREDERLATFPHDTQGLVEQIQAIQARLVVIDPIISFLAQGVQMNSDQGVRQALLLLRQLARRHQFIPLLVRHLNKDSTKSPVYRGCGAQAFLNVSRSGWLFSRHPEDDQRVIMAQHKTNVAKTQDSLAFSITSRDGGLPRVTWHGPCSMTSTDLLMPRRRGRPPTDRQRAIAFLNEVLAARPLRPREVWKLGKPLGLSPSTILRAKEEQDIRVLYRGHDTWWALHDQELPDDMKPPPGADITPWIRKMEEMYPPPSPLDERQP